MADLPSADPEERFIHDILPRVFDGQRLEVRRALGSFAEPFLATDGIDRSMVDQGEEERPECAPRRVERLGGSPERHERVVDDVLREHLLPREPVCQPVRRRGVPPIELVERAAVAGGEPPVQLQVVDVAVPHTVQVVSPALDHIGEDRSTAGSIARCASSCTREPGVTCATWPGRRCWRSGPRPPFDLVEIDVAGDDELEREYGIRIPVVEVDGEERFEYEVDAAELASIVRGA